jgi:hypothetical protein
LLLWPSGASSPRHRNDSVFGCRNRETLRATIERLWVIVTAVAVETFEVSLSLRGEQVLYHSRMMLTERSLVMFFV